MLKCPRFFACWWLLAFAIAHGGCRRADDANVQLARDCLDRGDLDLAIGFLDEAIRNDPDSAENRLLRGRTLLEKGDPDAAIQDLQKAVALGETLEGNRLLAQACFSAGEFEKAAAAASSWIEGDPSASAYLLRGRVLLIQSDTRAALQDLERSSQLDPQLYQAHLYQGAAHLRLEDFARAEACLTQSITAHPNNPYGFWLRAAARDKLSKSIEAEADRTTAKELDPALRFTKADGENLVRSAIEGDRELSPIERLNSSR